MALLPIWITSGSCFALIHPGTNDVPPTTSRSLMRTIELLVRKATGVHFTFLQILQKRVAGNTLSLGSTKNNIKYNNRENSRRYKYHDIMNAMLSALFIAVSGSNGRKLPPFKLLAVSKIEFATDRRSFATHLDLCLSHHSSKHQGIATNVAVFVVRNANLSEPINESTIDDTSSSSEFKTFASKQESRAAGDHLCRIRRRLFSKYYASDAWLTGNCERHFKDPLMHLTTAIATAVTQPCRIKTHLQQYAEG
ncbi:hypothetical protein ALC57_18847 [Trachymyrmex cornetzi]|uniref:Uncharacterized protein n=1 Tax=Trachymyrmex cornetzi TaxID=471704 RepID=A0A195D7M9_9HYME|nr:hypothetical protein ALC57_18847 [Trachymyrmex cornetzi]